MDLHALPGKMPTDHGVADASRVAGLQPDRTGDRFIVVIEDVYRVVFGRLQEKVAARLCYVREDTTLTVQTNMGSLIHADEQRQAGLIERVYFVLAEYFDQAAQIGSSQRRVNTILPEPGLILSVCRTSLKPFRLPVAV